MAIEYVASAVSGDTNHTTTTADIDTTGSNLLIAIGFAYNLVPNNQDLTDSRSNTWNLGTTYASPGDGSVFVRMYWSIPSSVGSGHNFTYAEGDTFPGLAVLAVSGAHASPLDNQGGAGGSGITTLSPGSLTPSEDNCLLVTGLNSDFGTSNTVSGWNVVAQNATGQYCGGGLAWKIQTTAGAENPAWTWSGADFAAANLTIWKSAAGGGGGAIRRNRILGEFYR